MLETRPYCQLRGVKLGVERGDIEDGKENSMDEHGLEPVRMEIDEEAYFLDDITNYNLHSCVYLPPYSPGLSPIEKFWSVNKSKLKREKRLEKEMLAIAGVLPIF